MSVGKQHTFYSDITVTDADGNSYAESISITTTLEGVEAVTVLAGTFSESLKFMWAWTYVFSDGSTSICESTEWLVKDVGLVKVTVQCQDTDADSGAVESYSSVDELVSATVGGVNYPGSSAKGVEDAKTSSFSVPPGFARSHRR